MLWAKIFNGEPWTGLVVYTIPILRTCNTLNFQSESVSTCQSYDSDRRLKSHGKCFQETDMWYTVPYSNNNVNKTKQTGKKSTPSSIIHPGKVCGPCCLCHKSQSTYRHLANMQEELVWYISVGHWPYWLCCCAVVSAEDLHKHSHSSSMYLYMYGRVDDVLAG